MLDLGPPEGGDFGELDGHGAASAQTGTLRVATQPSALLPVTVASWSE
jgi:hypothetical protein